MTRQEIERNYKVERGCTAAADFAGRRYRERNYRYL